MQPLSRQTEPSQEGPRGLWWAAAIALLLILAVELFVPARRQAQTPDEANHMLAGVRYWKYRDFGSNPEHPPLAKMVAALPILRVPSPPPTPFNQMFKGENFGSAIWFLYAHDADSMLLRARMAVSVFAFTLALLVLLWGCEMFGPSVGLLALLMFVFEPNLAAHGSIVATDMALACCFFAAVYAFYRWRKRPTIARLSLCGLAVGFALAAKHSGIFVLPVLLLLSLAELFARPTAQAEKNVSPVKHALRLAVALLVIGVIGYSVLWGFYAFRYQARPGNLALVPSLSAYASSAPGSLVPAVVQRLASLHLLPEAYLFGIIDIVISEKRDPMFLLGMLYATGRWFYFPVAFLIKSTLGLLLLLCLAPFVAKLWRSKFREIIFLLIPSVTYFAFSLTSTMNIGIRHILPVYPFLILLAAAVAATLAAKRPWGKYVAAVLIVGHVASSVHVFPNYLTYSNEAWGGPTKTYRLLTDSNVDWGQGLKDVKRYLDRQGIQDCWFAHYGWDVSPAYYHIACKPLPEGLSRRFAQPLPPVPATIEGTVLISATEADGDYWGPGDLDPYEQFLKRRPDAIIANSILVFRGKFDVPFLSALSHMRAAEQLAAQHKLDSALIEAKTAASLVPHSAEAQAVLGNILLQMNRGDQAQQAFQSAMAIANSDYPDLQMKRILHLPPSFAAHP